MPALSDIALDTAVAVAFSGRRGGISSGPFSEANISTNVGDDLDAVLENRRQLMARLDLAGRPLVTVRQIHSARVVTVVPEAVPPGPPELRALPANADGMVARRNNIVLMVGAADCAPVLLADSDQGVIGALHVGWRGLLRGAVEQMAFAMAGAGARRGAIVAQVGPAIGSCCLVVGADLRAAVSNRYSKTFATSHHGDPALDLRAGVIQALGASGIDNVGVVGGCTAHNIDEHFSARRDGRTGVQAGVIAMRAGY